MRASPCHPPTKSANQYILWAGEMSRILKHLIFLIKASEVNKIYLSFKHRICKVTFYTELTFTRFPVKPSFLTSHKLIIATKSTLSQIAMTLQLIWPLVPKGELKTLSGLRSVQVCQKNTSKIVYLSSEMRKTTDWHLISFFVFPHKTFIKKTRIEISILPAGAPGFFISERQQHKFTHFYKVSLQEKIHNSNDSDSNEQPFILALTHKHVVGRIVPSICIIKTLGFDVGMTILLRVRKSSQLFH